MSVAASGSEHCERAIHVVPETDNIVVVCLEGDFDLTNARALDAEIELALDGGNDVILDFSDASFVDSSVIRVVMRAAKSAAMREQAVVVQVGTAAIVERVFDVVKIEHVLPRAHDRQGALRMIRQQAASVSPEEPLGSGPGAARRP